MILETEILFTDELAETLNREPELIWGRGLIDLRQVASICEWMDENEPQPQITEITLKGGAIRIVKTSFDEVRRLWIGNFADEILKQL